MAGSYIPSVAIRPLALSTQGGPGTPVSSSSTAHQSSPTATAAAATDFPVLTPLKPAQYVLTFTNPIFDPVRVTLATPVTTPGRFASRVTVSLPSVRDRRQHGHVGRRTEGRRHRPRHRRAPPPKGRRRRAGRRRAGPRQVRSGSAAATGVSIVVGGRARQPAVRQRRQRARGRGTGRRAGRLPLREDEDLLEIPMFVRVEWETEAPHEVGVAPGRTRRLPRNASWPTGVFSASDASARSDQLPQKAWLDYDTHHHQAGTCHSGIEREKEKERETKNLVSSMPEAVY